MKSYEFIRKELENIAGEDISFSLDQPETVEHGDYATNIAFFLSKPQGISSKECADKLIPQLSEALKNTVEKIEVAGPGFINFFLKDEVIRNDIKNIENIYTFKTKFTGKKILVEHSSPNLFKPFHVGHLMNNITGEAVVRMVRAGGATVTPLCFPSDMSLGIAKAMHMILEDEKEGVKVLEMEKDEQINYLGEAYVRAVKYFDAYPDKIQRAKDISNQIYDTDATDDLSQKYQTLKDINLKYYLDIIKHLGSQIENEGIIFESEAGIKGIDIVKKNTPLVFTESEGAVVYIPEEERKDINTSVFINSEGIPTYSAKDIGLLDIKFSKYNPDLSFTVTDNEQIPHFKVVLAAAGKINKDWEEKSRHLAHGRMSFKGEKMSSRLGGVPLAEAVINTVIEEVKAREGDKTQDINEEERQKLHKDIALASLRFSILRSKIGSNINFDPDKSLSFEGDSGPYVQYTHARACSVLARGKEFGFSPAYDATQIVINLEKKIIYFENVITKAIEDIAPQNIVTYLFELASLFNNFYATTPIVVEGDKGTSHRLAITQSVADILQKALALLAVEAPERM